MARGPEIGDPAPDFVLPDQHGRPTALADLSGPALITFIPAAFTPVCHGELRDLAALQRDVSHGSDLLQGSDVSSGPATLTVLAVSCDSMFVLRTLDDMERLGFPLLSDFWPHGEVSRRYAAFQEDTGLPERSSFLVDAAGIVRATWRSTPDRPRDVESYRRAWEALATST